MHWCLNRFVILIVNFFARWKGPKEDEKCIKDPDLDPEILALVSTLSFNLSIAFSKKILRPHPLAPYKFLFLAIFCHTKNT